MKKYRDSYDVIVIGGGAGGLTSAIGCAKAGKKVLMIEKNMLGGECTWAGCVPSKCFISEVEKNFRVIGNKCNSSKIFDKVREVIAKIYSHETPELIESLGIDFINGKGYFIDKNTIGVNKNQVIYSFKGKNIVIATGSSPLIPSIKGLESIDYLTNDNFFKLKSAPDSILFIGGGTISLELAFPLAKLGTKVTILEKQPTLLSFEEDEVRERILSSLKNYGVEIILESNILKVEKINEKQVAVSITIGQNKQVITAEKIFISSGRKPNIDGLELNNIGLKYDNYGIKTDRYLQALSRIYAIGDVTGPYRFSHMAGYQGEIVVRNILLSFFKKKVNYSSIPWVTFTSPEYSRIGFKESEARLKFGNNIKVYTINEENDRSLSVGENYFFLKVICHKNKIVGATCVGDRSGEIINILQTLVNFNIPLYRYIGVLQAYPTYGDMLRKISKKAYLDRIKSFIPF